MNDHDCFIPDLHKEDPPRILSPNQRSCMHAGASPCRMYLLQSMTRIGKKFISTVTVQ